MVQRYRRGVVHKWGGTSVVTTKQDNSILRRAVATQKKQVPDDGYTVVVVSGMGKVDDTPNGKKATDHMYDIVSGRNQERAWRIVKDRYLAKLKKHRLHELVLHEEIGTVERILESGNIDANAQAHLIAFPEFAQARLLHSRAQARYPSLEWVLVNFPTGMVGMKDLGRIDVPIDHEASLRMIAKDAKLRELAGKVAIIPGFIGVNDLQHMQTATLERGSSDATATYWGSALGLDEIIIFSDKDGILPVDPRIVPGLKPLKEISYREAKAFAGLGASIIQEVAIYPAEERNVRILIRDSSNPDSNGTVIGLCETSLDHMGVKAIACDSNYAAIRVRRMRNTQSGVAAEVENIFAKHGLSIAAQYDESDFRLYVVRVGENLGDCLEALGENHPVTLDYKMSRIALVGDGIASHQALRRKDDAKGRFVDILESNNIEVEAYSRVRGSVMLSAVVPERFRELALQKLAEGFGFYDN